MEIKRSNQVWAADITYIRLLLSFCYLIAVMDWFSRYVLAWRLSITLEADFCVECLKQALDTYGCPEIFNTDQGSQFTSNDFTGVLIEAKIAISMDGRGRVFDNICVERLWRSVKHENVYIHDYQKVAQARTGLKQYFELYIIDCTNLCITERPGKFIRVSKFWPRLRKLWKCRLVGKSR